jgi:hypothetical protein
VKWPSQCSAEITAQPSHGVVELSNLGSQKIPKAASSKAPMDASGQLILWYPSSWNIDAIDKEIQWHTQHEQKNKTPTLLGIIGSVLLKMKEIPTMIANLATIAKRMDSIFFSVESRRYGL